MTAQTILTGVEIWCWIGLAVGALFLLFGIHRVDEDADGAVAFRPLLIVGIVLIWPLVLWRWSVLARGRDNWQARHVPPRAAHKVAAVFLAVAVVASVSLSIALKQTWPDHIAPKQIRTAGEAS
ncbi:MAG: hypothetical protein AAFY35_12045 [Pseudomonadota bacterium]